MPGERVHGRTDGRSGAGKEQVTVSIISFFSLAHWVSPTILARDCCKAWKIKGLLLGTGVALCFLHIVVYMLIILFSGKATGFARYSPARGEADVQVCVKVETDNPTNKGSIYAAYAV